MIRLKGALRDGGELEIRHPTDFDIVRVARKMRTNDRLEIERYSGDTPRQALRRLVGVSVMSRVALVDGRPLAMWGIAGGLWAEVGCPWAQTTSYVEKYPRLFASGSRAMLAEMFEVYPNMMVDVDSTYKAACRWLRWLGFELHGPYPQGPQRHLFYRALQGPLFRRAA